MKMNIRCSKYVEDKKNLNKTLILKSEFYWLTLHNCITLHGTKNVKDLTLNLPTTIIVAQPFNVIKWQLKFNPVA